MPDNAVAVIGGGPGGLVTAHYLKKHGFQPTIFEAAAHVGGQWHSASASSAIWSGMRTNTSRIMTAFSDLDYPADTAVYPSEAEVFAYLQDYVDVAGLRSDIHTSTTVEALERQGDGKWLLRTRSGDDVKSAIFARVVVATGFCQRPETPSIPGLEDFAGQLGAIHSSQYRGADGYRGAAVLVAGCSLSALEIASELAAAGAHVSVAMRRQRYVVQKLQAGVPTDYVVFTRFAAYAERALPPEAIAAAMKEMVVRSTGSPEQYGAPQPHENIFVAGLTQSQNYLALVADGRITPRPWISEIIGQDVRFVDGTAEAFDAVILGTGFRPQMPFLGPGIAAAIGLDATGVTLFDHTLHPDLPGLAFIGLYSPIGPYFPIVELQARWLAYLWAGLCPEPAPEAMRRGVEAARAARAGPRDIPMHTLTALFAGNAGIEPDPAAWPALERMLWFGPLSPASFRLTGPDSTPDAIPRTIAAASAFNAIAGSEMTADEKARVMMVRAIA